MDLGKSTLNFLISDILYVCFFSQTLYKVLLLFAQSKIKPLLPAARGASTITFLAYLDISEYILQYSDIR